MFDDEMVRLASEMSLMEDWQMDFDPNNLEETRTAVKKLEAVVDEHLLADQVGPGKSGLNSEPMSNAQIREIFAVTEVRLSSKGSAPQLATDSHKSYSERDSADSLFSVLSQGVPSTFSIQNIPAEGSNNDSRSDTVASVRWKLKWYQKKIAHQIQETHENHNYTDGRLAVLLELNDFISTVLDKADQMEAFGSLDDAMLPVTPMLAPLKDTEHQSARTRTRGPAKPRKSDPVESPAISAVPPIAAQQQQAIVANNNFPSVVSAVYALRRGGNRQETLHAVDNLIQLCNFGGELCLPAVKQMMAAGALQSLLSTLQRAADWPEVEKQISKVVSILVTYEDDWALLQRSALIILTALYTLQVKTLTQCRTTSTAALEEVEAPQRSRTASCSSQVTVPMLLGSGAAARTELQGVAGFAGRTPSAPMSPPSGIVPVPRPEEALRSASADSTLSLDSADPMSLDSKVKQLLQQQRDDANKQREKAEYLRKVQEEAEEEQESLKALISAAVAKLSLVLASEWGKLSTPLGGFGGNSGGGGSSVGGPSLGLGMGVGIGMGMSGKCVVFSGAGTLVSGALSIFDAFHCALQI